MNGWQIESLQAENLFSYKDVSVSFPTNSTLLVIGQNLDDVGASSNGSGKSSLFDIITWTIWGRTARSSDFTGDILRSGSNVATSIITFVKGDKSIRIRKVKDTKSKNILEIEVKEGVEEFTNISERTPSLVQKQIARFFGFDEKKGFDDYLSQVYFSSMSSSGFLSSSSPSDRQSVLERFLNLNIFDTAKDLAKKDVKDIEEKLVLSRASVEMLENTIKGMDRDSILSDLEKCSVRLTTTKDLLDSSLASLSKLESLKSEVDNKKSLFISLENDFKNAHTKAKELERQWEELCDKNKKSISLREEWRTKESEYAILVEKESKALLTVSKLKEKQASINSKSLEIKTARTEAKNEKLYILSQLKKAQQCPCCGANLQIKDGTICQYDSESLKKRLDIVEDRLGILDGQVFAIDTELSMISDAVRNAKKELDSVLLQLNKLRELKSLCEGYDYYELERLEKEIDEFSSVYVNVEDKFNVVKREYEELVKESNSKSPSGDLNADLALEQKSVSNLTNELQSIKEKEVVLQQELRHINSLYSELEDLKSSLEPELNKKASYEYWVKKFPEIKRNILKVFIPLFENTVNSYLSNLEITERVQFKTATKNKDGGTKIGFEIQVFDGENWRKFKAYSGGEKSRILVSVGFALRELSVQRKGKSGFDFLLIDELVDDLDPIGMKYLFELMEKLDGQKFLVTHTNSDNISLNCDYEVLVTKQDGCSDIKIKEV